MSCLNVHASYDINQKSQRHVWLPKLRMDAFKFTNTSSKSEVCVRRMLLSKS